MTIETRRRSRNTALAGVSAAVVAILALAAIPAFACTPSAQISARPARGEAGSTTNLAGSNFDPEGGLVSIHFGAGGRGPLLATTSVSGGGTFSETVRIPANATQGKKVISAWQSQSRWPPQNVVFEVTGPAPVERRPDGSVQQGPPDRPSPAGSPAGQAARRGSSLAGAPGGGPGQGSAVGQPATAGADGLAMPAPVGPAAQAAVPPPVALPDPVREPATLSKPRTVHAAGPSPWLLVPLLLAGAMLFAASAAVFVHELRQRRVEAQV